MKNKLYLQCKKKTYTYIENQKKGNLHILTINLGIHKLIKAKKKNNCIIFSYKSCRIMCDCLLYNGYLFMLCVYLFWLWPIWIQRMSSSMEVSPSSQTKPNFNFSCFGLCLFLFFVIDIKNRLIMTVLISFN